MSFDISSLSPKLREKIENLSPEKQAAIFRLETETRPKMQQRAQKTVQNMVELGIPEDDWIFHNVIYWIALADAMMNAKWGDLKADQEE